MTQLILYNIFNGLVIGAFYALMALGLSLILNLSGVINFAHGGFLAIGAYLAFMLIPFIGFWGALVLAPILTAVFGLVVERVLIRRFTAAIRSTVCSDLRPRLHARRRHPLHLGRRRRLPFSIPGWLATPAQQRILLPHRLPAVHGDPGRRRRWSGCSCILNYTRLGVRIRAGTLDLETVSVLGVNVRLLRSLNFGLGIYLAGLAGVLAAGMLGLQPTIGNDLIMPSFVAIIVGGLGSLPGTLLGGLLIGVASGVTSRLLSFGQRGGDLRHDGRGAAWCGRAVCSARRGAFDRQTAFRQACRRHRRSGCCC